MQKIEILKRYLEELLWSQFSNSKQDLAELHMSIPSLIEQNKEDLIIWFDRQIAKIEESWEVKLTDLFAHCNWHESMQDDFVYKLLCVSSGTDHFPEDEFKVRKDLRGARDYFKKPLLPERPIYIDIFDGYMEEFLKQFE